MIYTTETLREALSEFKNPNDKIHRMIREKKLISIIRGLYTTDPDISGKCFACFIYGPSYLSFDYALALYRLIDKIPSGYQSATYGKRRTKSYHTPFGTFTYRDIPADAYPLSVREEMVGNSLYRIASPEKALCDRLYTLPPAKDEAELEAWIFEIIGIDRRRFCSLNLDEILDIGDKYHSKNVNLQMEYALKIMLGRQE